MLTMLRNILCDGYGDRQHCRLSTFTFFLDTESETNPNNNLMMRRAGLSNVDEKDEEEDEDNGEEGMVEDPWIHEDLGIGDNFLEQG